MSVTSISSYTTEQIASLSTTDLESVSATDRCRVRTVALISSWVNAGAPETEPFDFTGEDGTACQGNFESDVQPLFTTPNLWYAGALSCRTCHGPDVAVSYAGLNLSSYQGIVAGSHRPNGEPKGNDILGGGNWDVALLHQMLYAPNGQTLIGRPAMPFGRPADVPANGPLVFAGTPVGGASPAAAGTGTPAGTAEAATPTATATP